MADLVVTSLEPQPGRALRADGMIRVRFSEYLDPDQRWGAGASLRSGEEKIGFTAGYDPVDRALVIVPDAALKVGLAYVFELEPESVRALDGRVLRAPVLVEFVAGTPTGETQTRGPVDFEAILAEPIARGCGCHGPPPMEWPTLRPETLINVPSRRDPNRMLVEPGAPLHSQLVLKLLEDYPGVAAQTMPPWGGLEPEIIRRVVAWVENMPR